jgi:hypothetical protein
MSEMPVYGNEPNVGKLVIEPTEDGTQIRISVTVGGHTELAVSLTLSLADAECVAGQLSDAIEEVSSVIEGLEEEVREMQRPTPKPTDDPLLVDNEAIPF